MDPFTLAIMALLASTAFKSMGMHAINNEQSRLSSVERQRQTQLEDAKQAAISSALPKFTAQSQNDQHQTIAQQMQDYMAGAQSGAAPAKYADTNATAPKEVQDKQQAALDAAARKGKDYAARLADVSAYNLANFNTGTTLNRLGEKTGEFNTEQSRSSQILPFELQAATNKGAPYFALSDLASGAGTIAGMYGIAQAAGPAAAGGAPGGTGITVPEQITNGVPVRTAASGFNPSSFGQGPGLRVPGVPKLVF